MKKYLIAIAFFTIYYSNTNAQTVSKPATGSSLTNSYSVSLPEDAAPWLAATSSTSPTAADGSKATVCFIEFGDGAFSFLPSGTHNFNPAFSTNQTIITKVTGVYGGGGKPPSHVAAKFPGITAAAAYTPMNILSAGQEVLITSNIGSVVANDTMIFVITYKTGNINSSLLFLLNDYGTNSIFENSKLSVGANFNDIHTGVSNVNFVRTYAGEIHQPSLSASANTVRTNYNSFSDYIYVDGLKADNQEHNIFVTLIPKANILSTSTPQTNVKAVLIKPAQKGGTNSILETENNLPIQNLSHDPNYITVKPACMLLPKANHSLDYHLHFQNTGEGAAAEVRVAVKVPYGVDFVNDISYPSASWYVVVNGLQMNGTPFENATHDSLIFDFKPKTVPLSASTGVTLSGVGTSETFLSNTETMGDVWFTIKTKSTSPDILLAQASIVFYNQNGTINNPILTNTAVSQFRECCDCKKECDPCKNKRKFWQWLFCKKC